MSTEQTTAIPASPRVSSIRGRVEMLAELRETALGATSVDELREVVLELIEITKAEIGSSDSQHF